MGLLMPGYGRANCNSRRLRPLSRKENGLVIGVELRGLEPLTPTLPGRDDEQPRATYPAHGTAEHETLEKPVTGSAASQAQDAAVKAVGSGTAGDVTTDVSGSGYEVAVTKSDGSTVEVHLNSSFGVDDHGRANG